MKIIEDWREVASAVNLSEEYRFGPYRRSIEPSRRRVFVAAAVEATNDVVYAMRNEKAPHLMLDEYSRLVSSKAVYDRVASRVRQNLVVAEAYNSVILSIILSWLIRKFLQLIIEYILS